MLLILKLAMDANDGLANGHMDHHIQGLLKGVLHASLGLAVMWAMSPRCLRATLKRNELLTLAGNLLIAASAH